MAPRQKTLAHIYSTHLWRVIVLRFGSGLFRRIPGLRQASHQFARTSYRFWILGGVLLRQRNRETERGCRYTLRNDPGKGKAPRHEHGQNAEYRGHPTPTRDMRNASPLRYPGGKWRLAQFFSRLVSLNFNQPPTYIEPYAGGASLALSLLFTGIVREIFLNDLDPAVYAFWNSILRNTRDFIAQVKSAEITPREWRCQRNLYASRQIISRFQLGFATFFLNRTNHSGILNGGMIGGKKQSGPWKLNARFNRAELISRIERIAKYRDRIHVSNLDAETFIRRQRGGKNKLFYLDPPYYSPGQRLYLNYYRPEDHVHVRDTVAGMNSRWIVSYDDVAQIRRLYRTQLSRHIELLHTARTARRGREVLFFSRGLRIPSIKAEA
jgi:DNA adenine methylase